MNKKDDFQDLVEKIFTSGLVAIPEGLLNSYSRLGMTPIESFLIMQLWYLNFNLGKKAGEEELAGILGMDESGVLDILAGLIAKDFIAYDENNGVMTYNLKPLYKKLFLDRDEFEEIGDDGDNSQLYRSFEGEFKRPLSPIEVDFLKEWQETKGYSLEMILEALKVAVAGGKLNFNYIDHILIDWSGKGVSTLKENKEFEAKRKPSVKKATKSKKAVQKGKYDDFFEN